MPRGVSASRLVRADGHWRGPTSDTRSADPNTTRGHRCSAAGAARGDSTLEYELQLRSGDFSTFVTSIAIDTVPERARLIATRAHKLMQLPAGEACKTVLAAIALGKEDESCLPLARIRSEGMLLDCTENSGDLRVAASTPGSATG